MIENFLSVPDGCVSVAGLLLLELGGMAARMYGLDGLFVISPILVDLFIHIPVFNLVKEIFLAPASGL